LQAAHVTLQGEIKLQISYQDERCTFTFIDSGPGYENLADAAPGQLPPIFQRYCQDVMPEDLVSLSEAGSARSKIEQGVNSQRDNSINIGLSLAYFLVQGLGAELRCSSQPGSTKFSFSLPERHDTDTFSGDSSGEVLASKTFPAEGNVEDQKQTTKATFELEKRSSISGRIVEHCETYDPVVKPEVVAVCGLRAMDPPTVLIVEDTAMCAKMLKMMLRKFKCSSTVAENGQIAIDMLRESPVGSFSLILMDIRMPVMDGLTATKIIKNELKLDIPVVALTAETSHGLEKECNEIGFDQFCSKPLKRNHLGDVLLKHTGYSVSV
jgi:CheY-like chemotaxis protein